MMVFILIAPIPMANDYSFVDFLPEFSRFPPLGTSFLFLKVEDL